MTVFYTVCIIIAVTAVLYLLLIMPRIGKRKGTECLRETYYAHRGLHDNRTGTPENSMEAFRKAVKEGYGIEMDVQLSKDGVPVVFHDFTLERVCGRPGKVCEYNYEELAQFSLCGSEEKIPKFADVLQMVGGRVPLIIELKIEWLDLTVCPLADAILRDYQGDYCIESFNPGALLWYRKYRNDVIRGQLSSDFIKSGEFKGVLYFALQNLLFNWMTKPDFVAYDHRYADSLSRRLCRKLYRNTAVAWTVQSREELEEAKKQFDLFIFDSFIPDRS